MLILIGIIVLISGCSQRTMAPKPLSEAQLDGFVKDKGLTPVAVKNVGNSFTVIAYENQNRIGYYAISVNEDGNFANCGGMTADKTKVSPVVFGSSSTGIPFVTVIINDKNILDQADKIKVRFNDGYEALENVNNQKGIIIADNMTKNGNIGIGLLQIFNTEGKLLFEYPNSSNNGLTSSN